MVLVLVGIIVLMVLFCLWQGERLDQERVDKTRWRNFALDLIEAHQDEALKAVDKPSSFDRFRREQPRWRDERPHKTTGMTLTELERRDGE